MLTRARPDTAAFVASLTGAGIDDVAADVAELYESNRVQWALEDEARATGASDSVVAAAKRKIDTRNVHRNALIERIDIALAAVLRPRAEAEFHSETPGMLIDRLSVATIRLHHTPPDDVDRLAVIEAQLTDLQAALTALLDAVAAGNRRFVVYRQFKSVSASSVTAY